MSVACDICTTPGTITEFTSNLVSGSECMADGGSGEHDKAELVYYGV